MDKTEAQLTAEARKDYYVKYGADLSGPLSEDDADELLSRLSKSTELRLKKLRVVKDYEA